MKLTVSTHKKKEKKKGTLLGPNYFECQGYGHMAQECANKLKKNTNLKVSLTWDDDSESECNESEEEQSDYSNYMLLGLL